MVLIFSPSSFMNMKNHHHLSALPRNVTLFQWTHFKWTHFPTTRWSLASIPNQTFTPRDGASPTLGTTASSTKASALGRLEQFSRVDNRLAASIIHSSRSSLTLELLASLEASSANMRAVSNETWPRQLAWLLTMALLEAPSS